ncbi:MAG: hypothetical protein CR988_03340 [Treponema sp.]|nr:MAG: hypothetical protein CR988_03340 [Treponema sp.]
MKNESFREATLEELLQVNGGGPNSGPADFIDNETGDIIGGGGTGSTEDDSNGNGNSDSSDENSNTPNEGENNTDAEAGETPADNGTNAEADETPADNGTDTESGETPADDGTNAESGETPADNGTNTESGETPADDGTNAESGETPADDGTNAESGETPADNGTNTESGETPADDGTDAESGETPADDGTNAESGETPADNGTNAEAGEDAGGTGGTAPSPETSENAGETSNPQMSTVGENFSPEGSSALQKTGAEPIAKDTVQPRYFSQREFKDLKDENGNPLFEKDLLNYTCYATALLNEISEEYTLATKKKLTLEEAGKALRKAIDQGAVIDYELDENGKIVDNRFGTVTDTSKFLNTVSNEIGLKGTWSIVDTVKKYQNDERYHAIFYNGRHFINNTRSAGEVYEVWRGKKEILDPNDPKYWGKTENNVDLKFNVIETRILRFDAN